MHSPHRASLRKIYLIQPKFPPSYWGQDHFLKLTPYGAVYPPLGLLTLAALTPPEYDVVVCDEGAGDTIDFDTDAEIVGITGYLFQLRSCSGDRRPFPGAGQDRCSGRPAANLLPDECRPHCDVLFTGEAEYTWPRFLREYADGRHGDRYHEPEKIHLPDSPPPRLDVLTQSYGQGIVQCTRGCPFTCEFCDIIVMYGRKMRFKPVEQVIQETGGLAGAGAGKVFFADDNFIGNRAYAKELLRAVVAWNTRQRSPLSFYTQASVDMVRDEELLGLMRDANFFSVFLGIETPRKASLLEAHKGQNEKLDLVEAVHKIQSYNLFVSAGMIVGFDHDDPSIFEEQYEFLQEAGIPIVLVNALEAVPGTPLFQPPPRRRAARQPFLHECRRRCPLRKRRRHHEFPAARDDPGGATTGPGKTVPEALHAGSLFCPADEQPLALPRRGLPPRDDAHELRVHLLSPGVVLLGQGTGGPRPVLGFPVEDSSLGAPNRRSDGHLSRDVHALLRSTSESPTVVEPLGAGAPERSSRPRSDPRGGLVQGRSGLGRAAVNNPRLGPTTTL